MFEKRANEPANQPHQKLQVNEPPLIEKLQQFDYHELLNAHLEKCGKQLKPIKDVSKHPSNRRLIYQGFRF
jgi:hypothetical protein